MYNVSESDVGLQFLEERTIPAYKFKSIPRNNKWNYLSIVGVNKG